jgi:hypothetical protein
MALASAGALFLELMLSASHPATVSRRSFPKIGLSSMRNPSRSGVHWTSQMRNQVVVVSCNLLFGCASPHWVKLDSASKTEPTQNSGELLRKALADCSVVASATRLDLDTLFGSESAYAAFQKCIYDKGYTKS